MNAQVVPTRHAIEESVDLAHDSLRFDTIRHFAEYLVENLLWEFGKRGIDRLLSAAALCALGAGRGPTKEFLDHRASVSENLTERPGSAPSGCPNKGDVSTASGC